MLADIDIEALFRNPESDRVERKASLSDTAKIKQAICAFANDYLPPPEFRVDDHFVHVTIRARR